MDINYKKGNFAIHKWSQFAPGGKAAEMVSGYRVDLDGVDCGLFVYKTCNCGFWNLSDVSTGMRITSGMTRAEAINNADIAGVFKYRHTFAYKWDVMRFATTCAKFGVTADFSGHYDVVALNTFYNRNWKVEAVKK